MRYGPNTRMGLSRNLTCEKPPNRSTLFPVYQLPGSQPPLSRLQLINQVQRRFLMTTCTLTPLHAHEHEIDFYFIEILMANLKQKDQVSKHSATPRHRLRCKSQQPMLTIFLIMTLIPSPLWRGDTFSKGWERKIYAYSTPV